MNQELTDRLKKLENEVKQLAYAQDEQRRSISKATNEAATYQRAENEARNAFETRILETVSGLADSLEAQAKAMDADNQRVLALYDAAGDSAVVGMALSNLLSGQPRANLARHCPGGTRRHQERCDT